MHQRFTALVSRFNWPHPVWAGREGGREYKEWIETRLRLFRDLTIRSIRNCDAPPNRWVILASPAAENIEERLADLLSNLPYKIALHERQTETQAIREALSDLPFPLELRTARIDTDDLIAADYFKIMQWTALQREDLKRGVLLTFPGGCNYLMDEEAFYFSSYPDNPFQALAEWAERPEDIRTVFFKPHHEIAAHVGRVMPLRSYRPMWASVVHDGNLGNGSLRDVSRLRLADNRPLLQLFGIE